LLVARSAGRSPGHRHAGRSASSIFAGATVPSPDRGSPLRRRRARFRSAVIGDRAQHLDREIGVFAGFVAHLAADRLHRHAAEQRQLLEAADIDRRLCRSRDR
jgi:hypothetical protein